MAEVYLARRRAGGVEKWLVVKRMRPERTGDATFLDLFLREAKLSMSLVHQNIVPVFDFGKIDDQVFLAMERVEGKDLGSSLARAATHRIPPLLAAFVAAECCQALDYAHQRKSPDGVALGVVHRDVTPRNVLLSWSGEVKLTDFGIAALAGDATTRLLGTPQYMAPEQARSEPTDPRADIYAVGLVLREAVTGVRPRPGGDRETILDAARRGELLPWPHLAPAATAGEAPGDPAAEPAAGDEPPPAALIAIIDRATALAPDDRYSDARSMLEDLDSFIVGERAAHKAESPARQLAAWLASVWEGARDDVESDAAIEGEHLISFLDDGGLDAIGTGTVRSLAATAAEDGQAAQPLPSPPEAAAPSATPPSSATPPPTSAPPSTSAVPPRASVLNARASRISSSTSTVASGSFHTIPEGSERDRRDAVRRKRAAVVASVLVIGAAGAAVALFASRAAPVGVLADASAPSADVNVRSASPPDAAAPDAERAVSGDPTDAGIPEGRPAPVGRPHTGSASAARPPGGARTGSAATAPLAGSGSDDAATRSAAPAIPATCRVRINLTPWAYYTVDGESTQHETPGTLGLTPGPHRLHVWNPELHIERDITINVPADRDTMNFSEPLQPQGAGSAR